MAEYIEREALLKEIEELKKSPWYNDDYGFGTKQARHDGVDIVVDLCIKQAPTADVVPVVRCKDCRHFKTDSYYCQKTNQGCCVFDDMVKQKRHYCGYGERRCDDDL